MSTSYVPKAQSGLLLRNPLTNGFFPPSSFLHAKPIYTEDWNKSYVLGQKHKEVLMAKPQKLAFYTRNNPHPARVCHMKGLLDVPICSVEDRVEQRYLLSAPTGQVFASRPLPKGSTRYSANTNKGIPAVGVVPVTTLWRDELERKTHKAILHAMGESVPPSRSSMDSQMGTRKERQFDHLEEDKLVELLCRILQTDSIPSCLAWLSTASETEKGIVLNMIKMAACGELQDSSLMPNRPHTTDTQIRYVWAPDLSQPQGRTHNEESTKYNYPYQNREWEEKVGGLSDPAGDEAAPFKLPENDTIVRTAHQLSRLASRNSSRADGMKGLTNFPKGKGHDDEIDKLLAQKLNKYSVVGDKKQQRQRSTSLNIPTPNGQIRGQASAAVKRTRSKSLQSGSGIRVCGNQSRLPPIGKASVTKETIEGGVGGAPRLRYTSHWEP